MAKFNSLMVKLVLKNCKHRRSEFKIMTNTTERKLILPKIRIKSKTPQSRVSNSRNSSTEYSHILQTLNYINKLSANAKLITFIIVT